MVKRGLGKGLGALIPSLGGPDVGRYEELPIDSIRPNPGQPRMNIDEEAFRELVDSVREVGLVQPIVVRPVDSGFEIVAGERRWRAAQVAGLTAIPAIVREASECESLELALIENIQREDLNPLEEAMAYRRLIDEFDLTQQDMANRVGKNRVSITNMLRLLQLPESVQRLISEGALSAGHAKVLLSLPDPASQELLAMRSVEEGLSTRALERIVRTMLDRDEPANLTERSRKVDPQHRVLADGLERVLAARVSIYRTQTRGAIQIKFQDHDDLERIFNLITGRLRQDDGLTGF